MKTYIFIIIFFALSNLSFGQFWKPKPKSTPVPQPTPVAVVTNKVSTTSLQQAKEVIKELNTELKVAKEENQKLKNNLDQANKEVKKGFEKTLEVQKNADLLKEWGVEQQNQAFEWMDKYTKTIKRYHRLKNIAAIVAGLFGAMLGMYCMRLGPPVYAAYAFALPIAGAVMAFGAVWMFF
jgi:Skp family chaperone for outer membrane proteins